MKYRRKHQIVSAVQYKPGMEDGSVPINNQEGVSVVRPYLTVGLSRHFMNPGDFIISDEKGRLSVMSEEEFLANYDPVDKIIEEMKIAIHK